MSIAGVRTMEAQLRHSSARAMRSTRSRLAAASVLALCIADCEPRHAPPAPGETMPLPVMRSPFDCDEEAPALGACEWLLSTDAVVWGTIRRIEAPLDLVIERTDPYGAWRLTTDCVDGVVSTGLLIELEITHSYRGSLTGVVQVRAGMHHVGRLQPNPTRAADGTLAWDDDGRGGSALAVGDRVGLALYYIEELDVWSLSGQPMFGVDEHDRIVFGVDRRECSAGIVPHELIGAPFELLDGTLAACGTTRTEGATRRRASIAEEWGWGEYGASDPARYAAGVCFHREAPLDGCRSDFECSAGQFCREGRCE